MAGPARSSLSAPGVEVVLDPGAGGRIAALRVDGLDLIVPEESGPLAWGAYPMVPWAGRLRDGTFDFRGEGIEVERTMPPNAIHGTALRKAWRVTRADANSATLEVDLAPEWPFGGRAVHRVELGSESLRSTLEVHAGDRPMPAIVGWHPWFPRRLARGSELELAFHPAGMLVRGPDGIPTGETTASPPGPWDDAFVGLRRPPRLRWPGAMELEIRAEGPFWVVYTEQPDAIAVEPQTGPPNGLATGECAVVEPGRPLIARMTLVWRRLGA
jgi:aldose 1-epimerase